MPLFTDCCKKKKEQKVKVHCYELIEIPNIQKVPKPVEKKLSYVERLRETEKNQQVWRNQLACWRRNEIMQDFLKNSGHFPSFAYANQEEARKNLSISNYL